ncbi:MAG: AAA family ATPase [Mariprofundaceae bacterium]|nr:AAA family ATPase [Mariprofundaceae bacterium]
MMKQQVLGHEATHQRFVHLMQEDKLPHAWLLHGFRGVGKSMLAQQLAAVYLCQHRTACGTCHSCCMLAAKSHPDFVQLGVLWDEKKKKFLRNINIAQIRDVLSFLALSGMQSQRRVVILDDADAMNNQAANALLKGLEEPTDGSLLLIICHDLTHLPATIRSRCMLEHCAPLGDRDMQQVLSQMRLPEKIMPLASSLTLGCPGNIAALQDGDVAQACLQWYELTMDLSTADIGALYDHLQKYLHIIPHDLIIAMLMLPLQMILEKTEKKAMVSYAAKEKLFDAAQQLLMWPAEVIRHSLRPAPALLSRILVMRLALKGMTM